MLSEIDKSIDSKIEEDNKSIISTDIEADPPYRLTTPLILNQLEKKRSKNIIIRTFGLI